MARNGSGTYTRTDGVRSGDNLYQQQESAGVNIEAALMDVAATDIGDEITNSLAADGQTNPTANLPMATYKHTGVGDASARTEYTSAKQLIDGDLFEVALTDGGTDAYAGTAPITISAYTLNMPFIVTFNETNTTTTPTVNIDSVGAKTLTKQG